MAVTLQVPISDAEQAYIVELAAQIAPEMNGPDLITWAVGVCKTALKEEVLRQARTLLEAEEREAANLVRQQFEAEAKAAWPDS